jgi:hypothetical protein
MAVPAAYLRDALRSRRVNNKGFDTGTDDVPSSFTAEQSSPRAKSRTRTTRTSNRVQQNTPRELEEWEMPSGSHALIYKSVRREAPPYPSLEMRLRSES